MSQKTIADVLYHLTFQNGFSSYFQLDWNKVYGTLDKDNYIYDNVNCLKKRRSEHPIDLKEKVDMIYVCGAEFMQKGELKTVLEFLEKMLNARGVIVFKGANPRNSNSSQEAWQAVARYRCDPEKFCCVLNDVDGQCAVLRPDLRSKPFALKHLPQYDDFEYLQQNRSLLLNLVSWQEFYTLIRFF